MRQQEIVVSKDTCAPPIQARVYCITLSLRQMPVEAGLVALCLSMHQTNTVRKAFLALSWCSASEYLRSPVLILRRCRAELLQTSIL